MYLIKKIGVLEDLLEQAHKTKTSISEKGVDWHIDHSLKVIIAVSNSIKQSKPEIYKWKFNRLRTYIFLKGSFPRGKGKAPKRVVAEGEIQRKDLDQQLIAAKTLAKEIGSLHAKNHFEHPYFGLLNLKKSIRFLEMHTEHHIKIIQDILS